jgi:hypothetical protein
MNLRRRLQRLEKVIHGHDGCPVCRPRCRRPVFLSVSRLADGTVVDVGERPAPCPRCGQVPEQIIEVVEMVVP